MRSGFLTWLVKHYSEVRDHGSLRIFDRWLQDPYLFHLNERSVPGAFAIGLFCAWIPLPAQMFIAAPLAIIFRVNVPLSVILVWVSNPITMPPLFYFAYLVGVWFTGAQPQSFEFEPSMEWLTRELGQIGEPFLIGCLILGIISSLLGYIIMKLYWNARLSRYLDLHVQRHQRRRQRDSE